MIIYFIGYLFGVMVLPLLLVVYRVYINKPPKYDIRFFQYVFTWAICFILFFLYSRPFFNGIFHFL